MQKWYYPAAIEKHRDGYIRYKKMKAKGIPLYKITDNLSERTAFINIDAWAKEAIKKYAKAIKRYAAGNHNQDSYSDEEIFAIENLYYLKKGEKPEWSNHKASDGIF